MKLSKIVWNIGLEKPLKLLHLSDTHFCYADERDPLRKRELALRRIGEFTGGSSEYLEREYAAAVEYAKEHCDLIVHTGDLIDFVSERNFETLKQKLSLFDTFFAPGNHEYSLYVGEAKEDWAYKMQNFARVEACSPNPLECASRVIGGVTLVAVDNGYYHFTAEHLDFLKREVGRGLPVILVCHTPVFTERLHDYLLTVRKRDCGFLAGTPDRLTDLYTPRRREQQRTDAPTLDFIRYLCSEPQIKGVLAGHLHFPFSDQITPSLPQEIAGGGYEGYASEITVL